jgi:hypothetical protein
MLFAVVLLTLATTVNAATVLFDSNPLAGNPALTTPGRQIVNGAGGGPVRTFDPATDVIAFDIGVFGFSDVVFANGNTTDPGFPTSGLTVAVVQNASAAGQAATLLANQLTSSGPGLFMYFNAGLNVPRLVFSTDLGDPDADLAILARFDNLTGQTGILPSITAANFTGVPEPSTVLLTSGALLGLVALRLRRRRDE